MNKVFKAISDPTRRRILELLRDAPMSAGDLGVHFHFSQPTMSAHFAVLKEANLIEGEKIGKQIIFHAKMSILEDVLMSFTDTVGLNMRRQKITNNKIQIRNVDHEDI